MKIAVLFLAFLLAWNTPGLAFPHGGLATPLPTNAVYPAPQVNYATNGGCATNYYVNGATGSDSYNGTSQTFTSGTTGPWATITHAETTLSGTHAATCVNVAAGTYAADTQIKCQGNTNAYTGYCALRCAPNGSTATARPYLYAMTNGVSGSQPACAITNTGHNDIQLGGVVATSDGTTAFNYFIFDGFEVADVTTYASSITNVSYVGGTGLVTATIGGIAVTNFTYNNGTGVGTWTVASNPSGVVNATIGFCTTGLTGTGSIATANNCFIAASQVSTTITANIGSGLGTITYSSGGTITPPIAPTMCFTVSGVTGTGSIASVNGYQCATTGTLGTTVVFPITKNLTLGYTSGGTLTQPDPHGSGSATGSVGIGQGPVPGQGLAVGCHHCIFINNYVHDMGGAGIQVQSSDYFTMYENVVVSNAWTNPYSESGLDITYSATATEPTFTPGVLDGLNGSFGATGHVVPIHSIVANNVSRNNGNGVGGTDGNGIIVDINNLNAGTCATPPGTNFGTLIYGDILYNNAGRGINMFNTSNVAVLNNTAYNNAKSIWNNNSAVGNGPYVNCGSYNYVKNNISEAVPEASGKPAESYPALDGFQSPNPGIGDLWNNNILYVNGTTTTCGGATSVSGTTCFNGLSQIYNAASKPAAWAIGTTYGAPVNNTYAGVTGSDGNTYASLSATSNVGHNPVSDAPTPGTQGTYWQNDGSPNNLFTDPLITTPGGLAPVWTLQNSSPAINASGADVTGLGGYTVATPNIGAQ